MADIPPGAIRLLLANPGRQQLTPQNCDVECSAVPPAVYTFYRSQLSGQRVPYAIELNALSAQPWSAAEYIAASGLRRPFSRQSTGFLYTTPTQGQTGYAEPKWPTVLGGTVVDGSITWTAVAPVAAAQDTIENVAWVVVGTVSVVNISSGIVNISSSQPIDGPDVDVNGGAWSALSTWAWVLGGNPAEQILITATITMTSGSVYLVQIVITFF